MSLKECPLCYDNKEETEFVKVCSSIGYHTTCSECAIKLFTSRLYRNNPKCPLCRGNNEDNLNLNNIISNYNCNIVKNTITLACQSYLEYFNNKSTGLFTHHGTSGRRKVESLLELVNTNLTLNQIKNYVKSFFTDTLVLNNIIKKANVNCNSHSFIGFYLNAIVSNYHAFPGICEVLIPNTVNDRSYYINSSPNNGFTEGLKKGRELYNFKQKVYHALKIDPL